MQEGRKEVILTPSSFVRSFQFLTPAKIVAVDRPNIHDLDKMEGGSKELFLRMENQFLHSKFVRIAELTTELRKKK